MRTALKRASKVTVRAAAPEDKVLATLQIRLLPADMAEIFVSEFQREIARPATASGEVDREAGRRLRAIRSTPG